MNDSLFLSTRHHTTVNKQNKTKIYSYKHWLLQEVANICMFQISPSLLVYYLNASWKDNNGNVLAFL